MEITQPASIGATQLTTFKTFILNLSQVAGTYDLATVSGADINILNTDFYVSVAGVGLTSVACQTNDTTVTALLTSTEGLLAGLTVGKPLKQFATRTYLPVGKKIQYTIVGTGSAGSIVAAVQYLSTAAGALLS